MLGMEADFPPGRVHTDEAIQPIMWQAFEWHCDTRPGDPTSQRGLATLRKNTDSPPIAVLSQGALQRVQNRTVDSGSPIRQHAGQHPEQSPVGVHLRGALLLTKSYESNESVAPGRLPSVDHRHRSEPAQQKHSNLPKDESHPIVHSAASMGHPEFARKEYSKRVPSDTAIRL